MTRSKKSLLESAPENNGQSTLASPAHRDVLEHEEELLSKPNSVKGRLQRLALKKMRAKDAAGETPTSIRFVFYELEQEGHVSKRTLKLDGTVGKRKPDADLTAALTHLREVDLIPWDWLEDESRRVLTWGCEASVRDYLLDQVDQAEIDRFPDVACPVILCESRGVAGVLHRSVGREYCVTVIGLGGQCNGFLRTKVASYLEEENTRVLYAGDHDLCGNDIEENSMRVLEHATGRTFDEDTWERLLLTDAQCRQLMRKGVEPIQKKDRRFTDGRPHEAFEAEALGQSVVIQIARKRLEQLAPVPLAEVRQQEIEQRAEMIKLLNRGRK
jgi:hypothetical protein